MADFDDMNATPLGKLPLPAVQSKADGPRVDGASVSYADLLKDMTASQRGGAGPAPQQQHQAPQHQTMDAPLPQQFGYGGGQAPQQHFPQMQQQPEEQMYARYPSRMTMPRARKHAPPPPSRRRQSSSSRAGRGVLAKVREYKSSLLVTLIIFLVLWYAAPKLAQLAPQLLNPGTGKFNMAGLLVIASACGGIHRLADRYVQ